MLDLLRTRVLPWIVWIGVMGAATRLWQGLGTDAARGFVEATPYHVATPQAGTLATLTVAPGQRVVAGQVIATLDDRELTAELAVLAAEGRRVEAELRAVASDTQVRVGETSRGIEEAIAAAERGHQAARADRSVRTAELAAMSSQLATLEDLVGKRMADRRDLDALKVKHAALTRELTAADALITQLASQAAAAKARRDGLPPDAADRATDPLHAELAVIREREQLLRLRIEALALRAPADGEVTAVHLRPGEVAAAGALVATLGPGPALSRVYVCLGEPQAALVRADEAVLLRAGAVSLPAHVEHLAPEVVELPPRCWRDPRSPEWGRAAFVVLDEPAPLLPGQGFAVAFTGAVSPHANRPTPPAHAQAPMIASTPPATPTPREPTPLTVPASLLARTRFEPSALTWSPRLDRFVVVSDDAGLAGRGEHAPWLFTMDRAGRVDPGPLVIAGVDALSDLESIAPAPDGGLYVLASQSRSRKGKRPPARQRFVHVALDPGARADASVPLADLLDAAGHDALTALGLTTTADLDIEGMTVTADGGLLLGLKAPLGPDGAALIWQLPRPDALLAGSTPTEAGLTLWGRVPLTVTADGASVPGGISELLELADGSLVITATASGTDPITQDGALVHVARRGELATPRIVRVFPALKPEGLARVDGAIVIVFDTGAAAPQWMEQPWPVP